MPIGDFPCIEITITIPSELCYVRMTLRKEMTPNLKLNEKRINKNNDSNEYINNTIDGKLFQADWFMQITCFLKKFLLWK